jgi:HAD superfamily hydrolase (TIGR01509 family)
MAIATANDEPLYRPCIEGYFDAIADVNTAKEGKQSAKIYLDLASKMNSLPENTLVLEDMPTCVKTANRSGFITVAVYDNASKNYDDEKKNNSILFINDFKELIDKLS